MNPSINNDVCVRMNSIWDQGNPAHLKSIFDFAYNLPPSLHFRFIKFQLRPPARTKSLRAQFNDVENKRDVFRFFGRVYGAELLLMGISQSQIDRMVEFGYKPKALENMPLDMTIDHIKSLRLGGSNGHYNLCLMPGKYNHFKDILENLQLSNSELLEDERILTIVPARKNGFTNRVPFIDGGFRQRISNAGLHK